MISSNFRAVQGILHMKRDLTTFVRYLAVGALNTGFGYTAYGAFILMGAPVWLAVCGSTILAFCFNFMSYGGMVFGNLSWHLLPRFVGLYAFLGLWNFVLLIGLEKLGLDPLWGQALLLPFLAIAGFFGLRLFVFGWSVT